MLRDRHCADSSAAQTPSGFHFLETEPAKTAFGKNVVPVKKNPPDCAILAQLDPSLDSSTPVPVGIGFLLKA